MNDVSSFNPILSPLKIGTYFQGIRMCIEKLSQGRRLMNIKGKKKEIFDLVYESNFFEEQYQVISSVYDEEKLEAFKKELTRTINCGVRGTFMGMPGVITKKYLMCKGRGCVACSPYQANIRVRYSEDIAKVAMTKNIDDAKSITYKMKAFIDDQNWPWLPIIYTPFEDGRVMVRLINLRQDEMNPLLPDNEVKQSVAAIDELFPMFEGVTRVSADNATETVYITDTNQVKFTSTELYIARPNGKSGTREGGTERGYSFDAETGCIIHMTESERKKKEKDEAGIIDTLNIPAVAIQSVPEDIITEATREAVDEIITGDIAVMKADDVAGIKHLTIQFMNGLRDGLSARGYEQPSIFHHINITQDDVDQFYNDYGISSAEVPENLMKIEYTDEMLGIGIKITRLTQRYQIIKNRIYHEVQAKMKSAMTKKEFVSSLVKQMMKE